MYKQYLHQQLKNENTTHQGWIDTAITEKNRYRESRSAAFLLRITPATPLQLHSLNEDRQTCSNDNLKEEEGKCPIQLFEQFECYATKPSSIAQHHHSNRHHLDLQHITILASKSA